MKTDTKNWREVKLGDICRIKTGKTDSQDAVKNGAYPLFDRSATIKRSDKFLFDTNAIILPGEGAEFIPRFYEGKFDLHQRVYAIYCDEEKRCDDLSLKFLYYFLFLNREYFAQTATGATVKSLRLPIISDCPVILPPLSKQQQIADVLSTYDNLIENNTKRIKILEEIAQAIYREWFVYFRFPGHEKVKMIDSKTEFGKIPEGWKIGKLSDLAAVIMGQSPSSDFYNESKEGLPFHQGVTNFGFRFPKITTYSTEGTRRADAGDILFSVRAPVGRINVADKDMIIGRGLASMKSTSGHQSFLLYHLKHFFQTEDLIGGGAIFASVTKDELNNFSSLISDIGIIEEFEQLIRPIDRLVSNITSRLSILKESRDLLLPKLVTGEIRV